jgi:hypothetical protein
MSNMLYFVHNVVLLFAVPWVPLLSCQSCSLFHSLFILQLPLPSFHTQVGSEEREREHEITKTHDDFRRTIIAALSLLLARRATSAPSRLPAHTTTCVVATTGARSYSTLPTYSVRRFCTTRSATTKGSRHIPHGSSGYFDQIFKRSRRCYRPRATRPWLCDSLERTCAVN